MTSRHGREREREREIENERERERKREREAPPLRYPSGCTTAAAQFSVIPEALFS
jgi:hypothetical protein